MRWAEARSYRAVAKISTLDLILRAMGVVASSKQSSGMMSLKYEMIIHSAKGVSRMEVEAR